MNDQNLNLVLGYGAFLVMILNIRDITVRILFLNTSPCHFWKHKMFSSIFKFHFSEHNSPFFTNPSVKLFLEALSFTNHSDTTPPFHDIFNVGHIDESTTTGPKASSLSIDPDPPQSSHSP